MPSLKRFGHFTACTVALGLSMTVSAQAQGLPSLNENSSAMEYVGDAIGHSIGLGAACGYSQGELQALQAEAERVIKAEADDQTDANTSLKRLKNSQRNSYLLQQEDDTSVDCKDIPEYVQLAYGALEQAQTEATEYQRAPRQSPLNFVEELGDQAFEAHSKGYSVQLQEADGSEELQLRLVPSQNRRRPDTEIPESQRLANSLPTRDRINTNLRTGLITPESQRNPRNTAPTPAPQTANPFARSPSALPTAAVPRSQEERQRARGSFYVRPTPPASAGSGSSSGSRPAVGSIFSPNSGGSSSSGGSNSGYRSIY